MKKFEGILICTDLDGTLLRNDKSISRENLDAIEYFKANGGLFTFITGRMPYYSSTAYNTIDPNAPFGCINGGGLYDHRIGEYIWRVDPLDPSVYILLEEVEKNVPEIGIQAIGFYKTYFSKENSAMVKFRADTGLPNYQKHYKDVEDPLAKIILADLAEENIQAAKKCLDLHPMSSNFGFVRSDKMLYEILPKGISKGTVLKKMSKFLGIPIEKTVAIGDYNNDVQMLRTAGLGVAVANATDEAKAAADHITVSNEEHAIARIVSDIESRKILI